MGGFFNLLEGEAVLLPAPMNNLYHTLCQFSQPVSITCDTGKKDVPEPQTQHHHDENNMIKHR